MLALFCLRLALGMLAALLLLTPAQVNPRFYRVHFLTVLALAAVALAGLWTPGAWLVRTALIGALVLAFLGSASWSIEGAPAGRALIGLTLPALGTALLAAGPRISATGLANDLTASALLGVALTAMLMGHSYLIAPSMSLTPLRRLLVALLVALFLRLSLSVIGLWSWTAGHSLANLTDVVVLWLPLRWGLGFLLPLVLTVLAWKTLRIPNTQSATGILYIVVVFCFLGELTAQLLLGETGYLL